MSFIIKYQLDFTPEIYEYQISQDMKFDLLLHQINKKENRSDLSQIVLNGSYIDLENNVNDFFDPENIFIIYGDFITFNLYINIDFSLMRTPIKIKLSPSLSSEEICEEIKKTIPEGKSRFTPFGLSFYISGGIKLETDLITFLLSYRPIRLNLYAVITPLIVLSSLKSRQEFLNPYNLSKASELNITCLAEYFHLRGSKAMDLIISISTIVYFPPIPMLLLSLMQKGLTREPFFQIISLLQTLFLGLDPTSKPENVFENIPYFCKYICSQYSNKDYFCNLNDRLVFGPDFKSNVSAPLNELWQRPTKESLFSDNSEFHVFPSNSIIRADCPCFAKNGLLLIEKKYQINTFFNPITKEVISRKVDATFGRTLTAKDTRVDIKPSNVKQTMIILVDCSEYIKINQLEQIQLKILKAYTENACRYRTLSLDAMMSFGFHTLVLSKMETYDPNFAHKVRAVQMKGKSQIYKAIGAAVDYLNAFNWNGKGIAFPNAKYRIVLVTAGYNDDDQNESENNKSEQKPKSDSQPEANKKDTPPAGQEAEPKAMEEKPKVEDLIYSYESTKQKLLESDVILDSFIMRQNSPFTPTIAKLSHYTGGSCIIIDNEATAKDILSQEAFLNIEFRNHQDFGDDSRETCDTEFPNLLKIEAETKQKLIMVEQSLPKPSNDLTKRIIQEYKYIKSLKEDSFSVFMVDNNITQWRVFIKAPPKANLDEKWFYLSIFFPDSYPVKPPQFKFISIPYHINISNEGRICLNYLDYEYNSSLTIAYLIICILELLESPNYDDPIDIERRKLYENDQKKFLENVKESAKNGKDSVDEWIQMLQK